jgi:hypothetical protein
VRPEPNETVEIGVHEEELREQAELIARGARYWGMTMLALGFCAGVALARSRRG